MRRLSSLIAAVMVLATMLTPWRAESQAAYPSQAVKLIVPNPPGGLPDTVSRIVGRRLQERLQQSVVVENRPGANGRVAVGALLNTVADGHSLLVSDGSILSINPLLFANLAYDAKDIEPIVMLARAPLFLAVHSKVPAATMSEFIAYAKARPGQLNYGSSGVGSTHHLSMEAMNSSLKLSMTHVPFKGTGESVPALVGGHIDVLFSAYPSLSGAADGNEVKLLATNGAVRSSQAPNLPCISEFVPGFDFAPVIGIFGRSGMPRDVVQKIAEEALAAVREPDLIRQLAVVGVEAAGAGPDDFAAVLQAETRRVTETVRLAGIKAK
jgi:tripartite-type tricarboxylate transporter receptor subunit TctC